MAKEQPKPRSWEPTQFDDVFAAAIQAIERGDASPEQQRYALQWVLVTGCEVYESSYIPGGEEGRRDSDHHEGRRYVGNQILKHMKVSLLALRRLQEQGHVR